MSIWLDTPRCRPAWRAVLQLLDDGTWHPQSEVEEVLTTRGGLAERTVANHLRSASARGWITRRQGQVRLGPTPPDHLIGVTK